MNMSVQKIRGIYGGDVMIELKFPLNITLDSPRPIFKAYINGVPFRCMLDTGADLPVFL